MVSIFHGPWLLGVDEATSPYFFDEPFTNNRVKIAPGDVKLTSAVPPHRPRRFGPGGPFPFELLPGGYPMQPAQALLRPIAKTTSLPDQNEWAIWLPVVSKAETQDELYVTKPKGK